MNPGEQLLDRLAATSGREIGVTQWRAFSASEADAYDIATGLPPDFSIRPPGPVRPLPVSPFYLASLLPGFAAELGFPTATDENITALNYGFDEVTWFEDVLPGDEIRDHVTVLDLQRRAEDRFLLRAEHLVELRRTGNSAMRALTLSYYLLLDRNGE